MPISYNKLFDLLEQKGWTTYRIRKEKLIGQGTLTALKNGTGGIDSKTIAKLCEALNCQPGDLMEYVDEKMERDSSGPDAVKSTPVAPDSDFVPQSVPQSEPQANKFNSDATPVTSQAVPNQTTSKVPGKKPFQTLTPEAAAAVDLNRLLQDIMYQITIQETFGEEALAKLLDKAKRPVQ